MSGDIRLGTRGSALALTQARWVADRIERLGYTVALQVISTTGDRITDRAFSPGDGKGVFVAEIERALLRGDIDIAVHSMKDLPGEMPVGLTIAAVPVREDPRDVLVGRTPSALEHLPAGAVVGTSSLRRRAQLLAARPDLTIADLRGNIDTRLRKLDNGQYDAICIAAAGLQRLNLAYRITHYLDTGVMLPATGQGALAIQARADDYPFLDELEILNHTPTLLATRAERTVLAAIGGGCSIPLGVLATVDGDEISLNAVLCSPDGKSVIREKATGTATPEVIGLEVAQRLRVKAKTTPISLPFR